MTASRYLVLLSALLLWPASDIDAEVEERMPPLDMDVRMTVKDRSAGDVVFRHVSHTSVLNCKDCHMSLYVPARGANTGIGMEMMRNGFGCGACHGKTVFGLEECKRCHLNSVR